MRSFLRKVAVSAASVSIICFCSCERHHPDELPVEGEHSAGGPAEHEHVGAEAEKRSHDPGDAQTGAATPMSVTPPPALASPTPAEFFPQSTPR